MPAAISAWVEEAARLPVAFAQVREDPWLDLAVVDRAGQAVRILMVASGGCTAAALATSAYVAQLHLVDPNPAQLALTRLKLRLLQNASSAERLALLGHANMAPSQREQSLTPQLQALGYRPEVLGPADFVNRLGPDYTGRYERVFWHFRLALEPQAEELEQVLRLRDPAEQARRVDPATPLGKTLDQAFAEVMSLPNLVRLFGAEATRNPVESFARHFARRTRHVLATLPAADNPFLWQMLKGCYPPGVPSPWLVAPVPKRLPAISWANQFMVEALASAPGTFDFVHLSNILDWLRPEKAAETLALAARVLPSGGWVLNRQLNSVLNIPELGPMFHWDTSLANDWHRRDRSFFYRALHVGRKR